MFFFYGIPRFWLQEGKRKTVRETEKKYTLGKEKKREIACEERMRG